MRTAEVTTTVNIGGLAMGGQAQRTGDLTITATPVLTAGLAGTLTTRTDADTGVVTLAEGHGLTDADTVDVLWSGGARRGLSITAYDATTITVDGGAGDDLPAEDAAVTVGIRVAMDVDLDGDSVQALALHCPEAAAVVFAENDGTPIAGINLTANEPYTWLAGSGPANPLASGDVGQIIASTAGTAGATLSVGILRVATE